MKVAIMQPYFLPYIGYFQLIKSVDKFIILDDVNFIKGGWINRNIIANKSISQWLTIPLDAASPNKLINEIDIVQNELWKFKMIKTIKQIYGKNYNNAFLLSIIINLIEQANGNLSKYLSKTISDLCNILNIKTDIINITDFPKSNELNAQERIISICKKAEASVYVNLPGGKTLYDTLRFQSDNIELRFIEPKVPVGLLSSGLNNSIKVSIIDLILRNSSESIAEALDSYQFS
jgi:ACT domain-containing protein